MLFPNSRPEWHRVGERDSLPLRRMKGKTRVSVDGGKIGETCSRNVKDIGALFTME